jgi:L-ascorbate metabolism protein UlaG (beta-lactamase superfamily)
VASLTLLPIRRRPSYRDRLSDPLPGPREFVRLLRSGGVRTSADEADLIPVHTGSLPAVPPTSAALTWIGHASFQVQVGSRTILIDPVLSERILGAGRRLTPAGLGWAALAGADAVLISHNHYDHLDAPTVRQVARDTPFFVPAGLGDWFRRRRFTRVTELDWWESALLDELELTFVPAHHWSRRGLFDMCRSLWGGWMITGGGTTLYHAGDTGYGPRLAEVGARFPEIDLAMLPIGAYEPRWFMRPVHMDPEEAVLAAVNLGARRMVGMHWGTFRLSREPVLEPPRRMRTAWAAAGRAPEDLWELAVGETRSLT